MQKNIIKYVLRDNVKGLLIMFSIIIVIIGGGGVAMTVNDKLLINANGWELTAIIYMFCSVLASADEYTRYFTQNGFSRKTIFENFIVSYTILAFALMVFTQIACAVSALIYGSAESATFAEYLYLGTGSVNLFNVGIWLWLLLILSACLGYAIGAFYAAANKAAKIAVSVSVPVFFTIALPIMDTVLFQSKVFSFIYKGFSLLLGFYQGSYYIWLSAGSLLILSGIILSIVYPAFIRRRNFS